MAAKPPHFYLIVFVDVCTNVCSSHQKISVFKGN